ncbi:DUF3592 domain-containing protein [Chondromyces crocatus]|uniref:DUF3592 domain-containing protein n=1 Tax=Chondromyces crocatus TaxID=52 RepID=A0A0K1EK85_CHOCO|nr:DUF3592 domain-containing protein [Chondromyces crocatus]AKT41276.1 uncharacterized protein CMC5_054430 [Chondromyces crocatus]
MKTLFLVLLLLPAVLCFGLRHYYMEEERAFERDAERVPGKVKAVHKKTHFDGRDSEDITTVEVTYLTKDAAALTAEAQVGYAVGLSAGKTVEVLYRRAEPTKIQIRAGFFNRSGKVVFLTLFGGFWLIVGLAGVGLALRAANAAKDPAARERLERMREDLRREQAEREHRAP